MTMRKYVDSFLQQYPQLQDLLAADSSNVPTDTRTLFPPHLSMAEMSSGLKAKRLLKGTIRCRREDWRECYVIVHTAEGEARRSVTITGDEYQHRCPCSGCDTLLANFAHLLG